MSVPTSNVVVAVGAQEAVVTKLGVTGIRTADGAPTSNVVATVGTPVIKLAGAEVRTVEGAAVLHVSDMPALAPTMVFVPMNLVFAPLLLRMGTCFNTLPVPCVLLRKLPTLALVDALPPDLVGRETTASDLADVLLPTLALVDALPPDLVGRETDVLLPTLALVDALPPDLVGRETNTSELADVLRVLLFVPTALAVEGLPERPALDPTRFLFEEVSMEDASDEHNPSFVVY